MGSTNRTSRLTILKTRYSICLSTSLPACMPLSLSLFLCVCLCPCLPLPLSACLCLSVCQSLSISVGLSVSPSLSLPPSFPLSLYPSLLWFVRLHSRRLPCSGYSGLRAEALNSKFPFETRVHDLLRHEFMIFPCFLSLLDFLPENLKFRNSSTSSWRSSGCSLLWKQT